MPSAGRWLPNGLTVPCSSRQVCCDQSSLASRLFAGARPASAMFGPRTRSNQGNEEHLKAAPAWTWTTGTGATPERTTRDAAARLYSAIEQTGIGRRAGVAAYSVAQLRGVQWGCLNNGPDSWLFPRHRCQYAAAHSRRASGYMTVQSQALGTRTNRLRSWADHAAEKHGEQQCPAFWPISLLAVYCFAPLGRCKPHRLAAWHHRLPRNSPP